MSLKQLMKEFKTRERPFDIVLEDIKNVISTHPESIEKLNAKAVSELLNLIIYCLIFHDNMLIELIVKFSTSLSPLHRAVLQSSVELVKSLLKNGEKLEGPEWYMNSLVSCLFWKKNCSVRKDMLTLFIEHGFDTGFRNSRGCNLLHKFGQRVRAGDTDGVEVASILIELGVPVNEPNDAGYTPFDLSVVSKNHELVLYLIEKGADVKRRRESEQVMVSPLCLFAKTNETDLIDLFLSSGHDINQRDMTIFDRTPLHQACEFRVVESIRLLLEKGADVNAECRLGHPPFQALNHDLFNIGSDVKIMIKEFAKLRHENLPISQKNMDMVQAYAKTRQYFELCLDELEKISCTVFYAPYSYYFVLKVSNKKIKKLSKLTKNKEFVAKFKENICHFSCYTEELEKNFAKAIRVRDDSLLVELKLRTVFKDFLPDIVIKKLTDNLTVKDLPGSE